MFFWVKPPCERLVEANVSEKLSASVFRAEMMNWESFWFPAYHFSPEDGDSTLL
jgi:hypothetical protein